MVECRCAVNFEDLPPFFQPSLRFTDWKFCELTFCKAATVVVFMEGETQFSMHAKTNNHMYHVTIWACLYTTALWKQTRFKSHFTLGTKWVGLYLEYPDLRVNLTESYCTPSLTFSKHLGYPLKLNLCAGQCGLGWRCPWWTSPASTRSTGRSSSFPWRLLPIQVAVVIVQVLSPTSTCRSTNTSTTTSLQWGSGIGYAKYQQIDNTTFIFRVLAPSPPRCSMSLLKGSPALFPLRMRKGSRFETKIPFLC